MWTDDFNPHGNKQISMRLPNISISLTSKLKQTVKLVVTNITACATAKYNQEGNSAKANIFPSFPINMTSSITIGLGIRGPILRWLVLELSKSLVGCTNPPTMVIGHHNRGLFYCFCFPTRLTYSPHCPDCLLTKYHPGQHSGDCHQYLWIRARIWSASVGEPLSATSS